LDEHKVPPADREYFNAGALILRPSSERYEELLNVRGYDVNLGEQVSMGTVYNHSAFVPLCQCTVL
jgi:alpha-N-acetylglucosamine transferase